MDAEEKARAYYRLASELIGYIGNCAERGIVPLKHDADAYRHKLSQVRTARRGRS